MREMTARLFMLMEEEHTESSFKQANGRTMCRKCSVTWPCDTKMLIDSHKRLEDVLVTFSNVGMVAYGLVSELTDVVRNAPAAANDKAREEELALIARADEYLAIGMPS